MMFVLVVAAAAASCSGGGVTEVSVATITIDPIPSALTPGATLQLSARALSSTGAAISGRTLTWSSSNAAVADVNAQSGLLTARAPGTATISVTDGKVVGTIGVIVNAPLPTITSISPTTAQANSGALTLTVTGTGFVSNSVVQWNGTA